MLEGEVGMIGGKESRWAQPQVQRRLKGRVGANKKPAVRLACIQLAGKSGGTKGPRAFGEGVGKQTRKAGASIM
jgi:hypothetical protein